MTVLARRLFVHKDGRAEEWSVEVCMGCYQLVGERGRKGRMGMRTCTSVLSLEAGIASMADETAALPLFGYQLAESEDRADPGLSADWIPAGGQKGLAPSFL